MRGGTSLLSLCFVCALSYAEPVETELAGVTVELLELRQQGGALRLAVRFRNDGTDMSAAKAIRFGDIVLLNPATKQKYFGIKDADGRYLAGPVSDWNDGGRWWLRLSSGREAVLWMYFEAVAPGAALTVQLPLAFPFDDVAVTEGPRAYVDSTATVSSPSALKGSLISAKRANQELKVRVKLERATRHTADFAALEYRDAYVFDPIGKRKYALLKDTDGQFLAQPKSDQGDGGRYFLSGIQDSAAALMSLTFAAPPDDVAEVDVVLPWFVPFEAVQLSGTGGAAAGGVAAAGRAIGLEAALKELQAQVTPQEIRIELAADVLFDFDKAELKPEATRALDNLLTVVKSRPNAAITIEGHTDVRGDDAYNRTLSQRRAEAVRSRLVAGGIPAARLIAIGAGESRPVRTGDSEADHQANRRVEVRIRDETSASSSAPSAEAAICTGAEPAPGIAACTRIIEAPNSTMAQVVDALAARAKHRLLQDDVEGAQSDVESALSRDPANTVALHNRAVINFALGRIDAALADVTEEIRLAPDAEAYATRGRFHAELGRSEAALEDLNRAVEMDPRHVDALISRAGIEIGVGKLDAAVADLDRAIAIDANQPVAYLNRGVARLLQRQFDPAIADFSQALTLTPGDGHLHFQRAVAFAMSGRVTEGLADVDRTLLAEPAHVQAHVLRAGLLEGSGRRADALAAHRRVLELDPNNRESLAAADRLSAAQ